MKKPLADAVGGPYIAPSLGDGPAAGALGTQVAGGLGENEEGKNSLLLWLVPHSLRAPIESSETIKGGSLSLLPVIFCGPEALLQRSAKWLKSPIDTEFGFL